MVLSSKIAHLDIMVLIANVLSMVADCGDLVVYRVWEVALECS